MEDLAESIEGALCVGGVSDHNSLYLELLKSLLQTIIYHDAVKRVNLKVPCADRDQIAVAMDLQPEQARYDQSSPWYLNDNFTLVR